MKLLVMFNHVKSQSASPDLLRYHAAFGRERRLLASNAFCLKIMNGWMDLDDTYIYYRYVMRQHEMSRLVRFVILS